MNFAVGYQLPRNGELFSEIVSDYVKSISEVYFPWVGIASGRPILDGGTESDEVRQTLEYDLKEIRKMGVKLDLLLNGNCYGDGAVSREFERQIIELLAHLDSIGCMPEIVTTTSFFIARTVKKHFKRTEVRASVNMKLYSTVALSHASEYFDSFYIGRDIQRNIEAIRSFRTWCDKNGKRIGMLANSGCLRFCPSQTFHDNLVAHSDGANRLDNVSDWNPHLCHNLYADAKNYAHVLKSTWIRPEDLHLYEGLIDFVKLATRQHSHPRRVIDAYTRGRYYGNLLELLEPGFAYLFHPYYIDNRSFPAEWGIEQTKCNGECDACGFCDGVLPLVLKKYE